MSRSKTVLCACGALSLFAISMQEVRADQLYGYGEISYADFVFPDPVFVQPDQRRSLWVSLMAHDVSDPWRKEIEAYLRGRAERREPRNSRAQPKAPAKTDRDSAERQTGLDE